MTHVAFPGTKITSMELDDFLIVTTFDKKINLYNKNLEQKDVFINEEPVLYATQCNNKIVCADIYGNIKFIDLNTNTSFVIHTNSGGIEKINKISDKLFVFGGYRKKLTVCSTCQILLEIKIPEKVYHSDIKKNNLFCASDTEIFVYDIRYFIKPAHCYKNYGTKIESFAAIDNENFLVGGANGKIIHECIKKGHKKSLSFIAHKISENNKYIYSSVSNLQILNDSIYSSGLEGNIFQWNINDRKKSKHCYSSSRSVSNFIIDNSSLFVIQSNQKYKNNNDYFIGDILEKTSF